MSDSPERELGDFDRIWRASPPDFSGFVGIPLPNLDPLTGLDWAGPVPYPLYVPLVLAPHGARIKVESIGHTPGDAASIVTSSAYPSRNTLGVPPPIFTTYYDCRMRVTLGIDGRSASLAESDTIDRQTNGGTGARVFSTLPPPGFVEVPIPFAERRLGRQSAGILFSLDEAPDPVHAKYGGLTYRGAQADGTQNAVIWQADSIWHHSQYQGPGSGIANDRALTWWDWLQFLGVDSQWRLIGRFI